MSKKIVLVLSVVFLILISCLIIKNINRDTPTGRPITVCWWGTPGRNEKTEKVIKLYQQLHDHQEIETVSLFWQNYRPFIEMIFSGKEPCDIFQEDYAYLKRDAVNGMLIELDPYIKDGTIDVSNIPSAFLDSGRINNKLYGINLGTNAPSLIYDPAFFEKAGIEKPDLNWTWEDLTDIAVKIYNTTEVKTLPFFSGVSHMAFENILKQNGYSLFSKDGKSLGFNHTDILVYYFELQLKLKKAGALSDIYNENPDDHNNGIEEFIQGRSWIFFIWSNSYPAFCSLMDQPLELFLFPRIKNPVQPGTYIKPSQFFSVTSGSDKPKESAGFINFFVNNPAANYILLAERGVPVNTEINLALRESVSPCLKTVFDYISLVADGNSCRIDPPDPPNSELIKRLLFELSIGVINEEFSAKEGAERFIIESNMILSE